MKTAKILALCAALVCAATLITGCACCSSDSAEKKSSCGMKCCEDAKVTCATCATCTPKK